LELNLNHSGWVRN